MADTNILSLYMNSSKLHVKDARTIPGQAVNFVDTDNKFQVGWSNNQELKKTTFTDLAMAYYDTARRNIVIPESFRPSEEGINLTRWGPGKGYYNPGTPQG